MQMVSGAVTCTAYKANHLSRRDRFAGGYCHRNHVGIARGQPCAIVQQNLIAVAVIPTGCHDGAVVCGENRGPFGCWNINAIVSCPAKGIYFSEVAAYGGMSR